MSMETAAYRDIKPGNVELDRPAPWWKRAVARMRAWWRLRIELFYDRYAIIMQRSEQIEYLATRLREVNKDVEQADRAHARAANAMAELKRQVDKRNGDIAANLAREPPPPLPVPGPGRERLG